MLRTPHRVTHSWWLPALATVAVTGTAVAFGFFLLGKAGIMDELFLGRGGHHHHFAFALEPRFDHSADLDLTRKTVFFPLLIAFEQFVNGADTDIGRALHGRDALQIQ